MFRGQLGGVEISGTDFIGTELNSTVDSGEQVTLRIEGVARLAAPNEDVWVYQVGYQIDGERGGICPAGVSAIPLAGRWDYRSGVSGGGAKISDPDVFTFACRGIGAIAKCVELGYKPWRTVGGRSLADHHQACTRMIRNDLCGNGQSYTIDGRRIDLFDGIGVQSESSGGVNVGVTGGVSLGLNLSDPYVLEAEWTPSGGRCMSVQLQNRMLATGNLPTCLLRMTNLLCGDRGHFSTGTHLMNKVPLSQLYIALP